MQQKAIGSAAAKTAPVETVPSKKAAAKTAPVETAPSKKAAQATKSKSQDQSASSASKASASDLLAPVSPPPMEAPGKQAGRAAVIDNGIKAPNADVVSTSAASISPEAVEQIVDRASKRMTPPSLWRRNSRADKIKQTIPASTGANQRLQSGSASPRTQSSGNPRTFTSGQPKKSSTLEPGRQGRTNAASAPLPGDSSKPKSNVTIRDISYPPNTSAQLVPLVPKAAPPGPPSAPSFAQPKPESAPPPAPSTPGAATALEKYPTIAEMEVLTYGESHPARAIADRLTALETTVFKITYPSESLAARTDRLKRTLLGADIENTYNQSSPYSQPPYGYQPPPSQWTEEPPRTSVPPSTNPDAARYAYYDEIAIMPENRVPVTEEQLEHYFLQLVNMERQKVGAAPLALDPLAEKMAREHAVQLAQRAVVSHADEKGNNPDRRYTLLGGTDAVTESVLSIKSEELGTKKLLRSAAPRIMKVFMSHQDDRDALTSPDTNAMGFHAGFTSDKSRLIACVEGLTKRGIIHPIPIDVHVGDKLEVKGVVMQP
ncbi:MAG TPA: CAP domain-containing protein, partial [Candidatus Obscuribacterales bacterium]